MYAKLDLAGKVAVVVGGSSGIGRTVALGLAQGGADVVSSARRMDLVNTLADEIEKLGRRSLRITCDVADRSSLEKLLKECLAAFGKVDILVNAAGITKRAPTVDYAEEDWNRIMDTNLTGMLRTCQVFGKHMIERQYGRIISIASMGSFLGLFRGRRLQCQQIGFSLFDEIARNRMGQVWNLRECDRTWIFSNTFKRETPCRYRTRPRGHYAHADESLWRTGGIDRCCHLSGIRRREFRDRPYFAGRWRSAGQRCKSMRVAGL